MTETPPSTPPSEPLVLESTKREFERRAREAKERAEAEAVRAEASKREAAAGWMPADSEIWVVYVPATHPRGPSIEGVRANFFRDMTGGTLKIYRHAFVFSFADPTRCRRLVATKFLAPLQPGAHGTTPGATVVLQYGAPKGRGWGPEDLGTEFRVDWRWWGIHSLATPKPDDLLRKIYLEMGTQAKRCRKLPRTIPDRTFEYVWDMERLFGPWKVREA